MRRQRPPQPADLDLLAHRRLVHEARLLTDEIEHGPGWRAAALCLRGLREMLGLSIPALALRSGVSPRRLLRAERRPAPMARWTLARVLLGLRVPAGTFLGLSEAAEAVQAWFGREASSLLALPGGRGEDLPAADPPAEDHENQPAYPTTWLARQTMGRLAGRRTGRSTRRRPFQPPGTLLLWSPGPEPEAEPAPCD